MKRTTALLTFALSFAVAKAAFAQEVLPAGWLASQVNERAQHCDEQGHVRNGARLLVACGAAGVWEVGLAETGPRFVQSYEFPGAVVGFFTGPDEKLWVKLRVLEGRPFATAGAGIAGAQFPDAAATASPAVSAALPKPLVAPSPPTPPLPAKVRVDGRVIKIAPGEVLISLGEADGLIRSDRIELALEQQALDLSEDAPPEREVLAVGVVTSLSRNNARVRLGMNESVPVGALASRTLARSSAGIVGPPRVTNVWSADFMLRPFVALGELGGGFLLSGSVGRRMGHLHVWASVDPLGWADVQQQDSVSAASVAALASYDSQFFELGLGIGAQSVTDTSFGVAPGSGLAVSQYVRLGPQDGLNFSARTSMVLFHSQFEFGGMVGAAQFPVSRGYWLLFNGGGGPVGYGYGEIGVRAMLSGNGPAGSKYLTISAGGAGVFRSATCDQFFTCGPTTSFGGPMAGIGGEWRF